MQRSGTQIMAQSINLIARCVIFAAFVMLYSLFLIISLCHPVLHVHVI